MKWLIPMLAVLLLGCAGGQDDPAIMAPTEAVIVPAEAEPTKAPGTVRKCPADREGAGTEYLFYAYETTAAEAVERHCGSRALAAECSDDYADAGEEFTYDPDDYSLIEAQRQNCTAWTAYRGQTDGQVVVTAKSITGSDIWTLAIWCRNSDLYVLLESKNWDQDRFVGVVPLAYQFGDWGSPGEAETAGWSMASHMAAMIGYEFRQGLEFQPVDGEMPPESESEYTETHWIADHSRPFDYSDPDTHSRRDEYREFVRDWGNTGSSFMGIPQQPGDEFVSGLRDHDTVVFARPLVSFAFDLTGVEKDVEPVLQECGY